MEVSRKGKFVFYSFDGNNNLLQ